jgi:tetratricopeptide (TPR) repeat protein
VHDATRVRHIIPLSVCLLLCGRSLASPTESSYEAGRKAYDVGDFDRAIDLWKRAFEESDDASFLYDIGQAYRQKKDFERSIFFYQSFMRRVPDSPLRTKAESRIAEMRKAMDARPKDPVPPAEPPAAPSPALVAVKPADLRRDAPSDAHPGRSLRLAGLTTAGVGLGLLAVGITFALSAGSAHDELADAQARHVPWSQDLADLQERGHRDQVVAGVSLGVGAACVVGGVALTWLGFRQRHVALTPGPVARGLGLKVVF